MPQPGTEVFLPQARCPSDDAQPERNRNPRGATWLSFSPLP